MQTNLASFVKQTTEHDELDKILRSCVHCGFCNATCPTYLLTGNELDGPRGRIYLLKQMLEGDSVSQLTQHHLDRCLNCLACETTCPSGVEYGRLLDLGRVHVEQKVARVWWDIIQRQLMSLVFPFRQRFKLLIQLARLSKPFLPKVIRHKIPVVKIANDRIQTKHPRKILLLTGCVQPDLAPAIDVAAAEVLNKLHVSLVQVDTIQCCGALNYHLSEHEKAKAMARHNIDACWPQIEQGIEAIMMTASGCGVMLKDYAKILQHDVSYAKKALRFSALVKDLSEILIGENLSVFKASTKRVAFQSPCTLQHGQKLAGVVELILDKIGLNLIKVDNEHLCCGSAGMYSLLQPELSEQLRDNKLRDLQSDQVDYIATANIGCLTHLQAKTSTKVVHWVELLETKS